jgi:hypothetical protein
MAIRPLQPLSRINFVKKPLKNAREPPMLTQKQSEKPSTIDYLALRNHLSLLYRLPFAPVITLSSPTPTPNPPPSETDAP